MSSESYRAFRRTHGRDHASKQDMVDFETRHAIFETRKAEVRAHNELNMSWKMVVNHFSDYTHAELERQLGYKRVGSRWSTAPRGASSFLQAAAAEGTEIDTSKLAREVDWRDQLQKSSTWVRNQGHCGSCWAVAAVGAMEMQAEKQHGTAKKLSHQQLVDCVPNPRHCGGTGGCHGATGELAFEYARVNGIANMRDYKNLPGGACNTRAPSALKLSRFVQLPVNKVKNLYHAVATKGPTVVSVAGKSWFGYSGGVFSGCERDAVVSHAVLAVGYGNDPISKKDFWLVRNSWGKNWGESGHIRVERHMDDSAYSGVDHKPKAGVFCSDAPPSVPVSGMCGITSDSAYPVMSRRAGFANRGTRTQRIMTTGIDVSQQPFHMKRMRGSL